MVNLEIGVPFHSGGKLEIPSVIVKRTGSKGKEIISNHVLLKGMLVEVKGCLIVI